MYINLLYSILLLTVYVTENAAKRNSRVKGQTEAPQYTFDFSSVFEDASRVFGKVLEKMFAHKKLLGIEPRILS